MASIQFAESKEFAAIVRTTDCSLARPNYKLQEQISNRQKASLARCGKCDFTNEVVTICTFEGNKYLTSCLPAITAWQAAKMPPSRWIVRYLECKSMEEVHAERCATPLAPEDIEKVVDEYLTALGREFPRLYSAAGRRPHVNRATLREKLLADSALCSAIASGKDEKQLLQATMKADADHKEKGGLEETYKTSLLTAAEKIGFHLGLIAKCAWLELVRAEL